MRELLATPTLAALSALAVVTAAANDGRAQSTHAPTEAEACFESAERAQPLLKDHKLRAAQRELAVCARDVCPRAARSDCRQWLDDLSRTLPTVVFRARESRVGGDVAVEDVRVSADGEVVVPRIGDDPVPLDPGAHTLRFEHGGFGAIERRVELREGEARRVVEVVFRASDAAGTPSPAPTGADPSARSTRPETESTQGSSSSGESPESTERPIPGVVWGLLGGGAIALGVGTYFEAQGISSRSHLVDTCRSTHACAQSDVDAARTQVLTGDILVGTSLALLVGAAYFYFTRGAADPPASGWRVHVAPVAGGVAAGLEGSL
jgi:hypothetical protein